MKANKLREAVWWQGPVSKNEALEIADELLDGPDLPYELCRLFTGEITPEEFAREVLNSAGVSVEEREARIKRGYHA